MNRLKEVLEELRHSAFWKDLDEVNKALDEAIKLADEKEKNNER